MTTRISPKSSNDEHELLELLEKVTGKNYTNFLATTSLDFLDVLEFAVKDCFEQRQENPTVDVLRTCWNNIRYAEYRSSDCYITALKAGLDTIRPVAPKANL